MILSISEIFWCYIRKFELKSLYILFDFFQSIYSANNNLLTNNPDLRRIFNNDLFDFHYWIFSISATTDTNWQNLNNNHDENSARNNHQTPISLTLHLRSTNNLAPSITLCSNIQIEIDPPFTLLLHSVKRPKRRKPGRGDECTSDRVRMKIQNRTKRTKKINKIRWGKR